MTNQEQLKEWSSRTVQLLQAICDETQRAAGNPQGTDQAADIRALIAEHAQITAGLPTWQARLLDDEPYELPSLLQHQAD